MFLLDTVVLSELRKPQHKRSRNLVQWIGEVSSRDLFVSVVTIGEIERGIERGIERQRPVVRNEPRGLARHGFANLRAPDSTGRYRRGTPLGPSFAENRQ